MWNFNLSRIICAASGSFGYMIICSSIWILGYFISVKNVVVVLVGIAMNPWIAFGRVVIFHNINLVWSTARCKWIKQELNVGFCLKENTLK